MVKVQRQLIIKVKVQWSKFKGKVPTCRATGNLFTCLPLTCQPFYFPIPLFLPFIAPTFAENIYFCSMKPA